MFSFLSSVGASAKKKADESGLTEKVSSTASNVKANLEAKAAEESKKAAIATAQSSAEMAKQAALRGVDYMYQSGASIKQSAKDGTLGEKTSQGAAKVGSVLGSMGQSLYNLTQKPPSQQQK